MHVCVYGVCVWIYILTHMHAFMISTKHPHQFTYKNIVLFIYTHTHTYIHTYIHTYMYPYIHTYTWTHRIMDAYTKMYDSFKSYLLFSFSTYVQLARCHGRISVAHCDALRQIGAHFNVLQHAATRCNTLQPCKHTRCWSSATRCNALQHTTTQYNTL